MGNRGNALPTARATPTPPRRLVSALDAAEAVLAEAGAPLHYDAITARALTDGHWQTTGKTPAATVNARIAVDLKKHGDASRFQRIRPGVFALRAWGLTPDPPKTKAQKAKAPEAPKPPAQSLPQQATPAGSPAATPTLSFTDAAEHVLNAQADRTPLHYRTITERALQQGLVQTAGKTPEATLYAQVLTEIKRQTKRGDVPRFVKHGKGIVGLRKWMGKGLAYQVGRHNADVRRKLLAHLKALDPAGFEALIGHLLVALGFDEVVVTKASNDGGIDVRGTLVVGEVVRTDMAVQVKRWKGNVQAPTVQQVRGSLGVHEQGLIITTSGFSKGAREEATAPGKTPVGLMDGEAVVRLLVEHGIGVTRTPLDLLEIAPLDAEPDGDA